MVVHIRAGRLDLPDKRRDEDELPKPKAVKS
jgi:hypothetical protein